MNAKVEDFLNLNRKARRRLKKDQGLERVPGFNKPYVKLHKVGPMGDRKIEGESIEEYNARMDELAARRQELDTGVPRKDPNEIPYVGDKS